MQLMAHPLELSLYHPSHKIQVFLFCHYLQPIVAFVNAVQFLYSLAILLSTPLQLFPAIRILENAVGLALRSGKQNLYIKWKKNVFRSIFVIVTAGISAAGANSLERFVSLTGSLTW